MENPNSTGTAFADYYARTKEEDDREVIDAEREKQGQNIRLGNGEALVGPDEDPTPPPPLKLDEHSVAPALEGEDEEGQGESGAPVEKGFGERLVEAGKQAYGVASGLTTLGALAPSLRPVATDVAAQFTVGAASDVVGMAAGVGAGLAALPFDIAEVAKAAPTGTPAADIVTEAAGRSYEWGKSYREAIDYPAARTGPGEIARFMGTFLMVESITAGTLGGALPFLGAGADLGGFAGTGAMSYAKQASMRVYNSPSFKRMISGAIADAVVSSEYENFSAILHENGIDNALVNALRYEPDDPKMERAFKSAVEGMLIPAVLRGAFKTAKGTVGAIKTGYTAMKGGKQEVLDAFYRTVALARDFNKAPAAIREEATAAAAQMQRAARASTGEPGTVGIQPPLETAAAANGTVIDDVAEEAVARPTTVLGEALTPETVAAGNTATGAYVKTAVNMRLRKAAEQAWAEGKWSSGDVIFRSWSREFHTRIAEAFAEAGNPLTKTELRFIRKLYEANALRWANEAGAPAELYYGYRFGQLGMGGGRKGARKSVQEAIRVIVEADVKKAVAQAEKKGGTALMQEGEQAVGKGAGKPVTVTLPSTPNSSPFFTGGATASPEKTRLIDRIIGYHGTDQVGMVAELLSTQNGLAFGKLGHALYTGSKVLAASYGGKGALNGAKILYKLGLRASKDSMLKLGEFVLDTSHVLDEAIDPRHERVKDILLEAAQQMRVARQMVWDQFIPKTEFDDFYRRNPELTTSGKPAVGVIGETVDAYGGGRAAEAEVVDNPELVLALKNIENGTFEKVYMKSFMEPIGHDIDILGEGTAFAQQANDLYRTFIDTFIYQPLREIDYEILINPHARGNQPAMIVMDPTNALGVGAKLDISMFPVASPRVATPGRFGAVVTESPLRSSPKDLLAELSDYNTMGSDILLLNKPDVTAAVRLAETGKSAVDEVVRGSAETMTTPMDAAVYSALSPAPGRGHIPAPGVGFNSSGTGVVSSVQPVTFAHNVSLEEQYDALRAVAATAGSRTGAPETRILLATELPPQPGEEMLGMFTFADEITAINAMTKIEELGIRDAHIMGDQTLYIVSRYGDEVADQKLAQLKEWAKQNEVKAASSNFFDIDYDAEFDLQWATLYTPKDGKAGAIANGQYQGILDEFAAKYPESDKSGLRARLGLNVPREPVARRAPRKVEPSGGAEGVGRDGGRAADGGWVPEGEPGFRPDVAEPGIAVPPALVKQQLSAEKAAANAIAAMTNSANPNDFARFYQSERFNRYRDKVNRVVAETYGDVNLLRVKTDPNSTVGMFMRASTRADAQGVEYFVRADEVLGIYPNGDLIMSSHGTNRVPTSEGVEAATTKLFVDPSGALYQTGEETGTKGMISFLDDARVVISLVKGRADYTTFIHESAHLFLRDLDIMPDAPVEELYKWAGVTSGTDYKDWPVEAQEKWARAFERFCTEGKLPEGASNALVRLFNKQKQSMREVYGKIIGTEIDVDMDPEVAKFMGKIIAGDTSGLSGGIDRAVARFGTTFDRDAEGNVFINFDRIHDPDDIRGMMQEFANLDRKIVDKMLEGTATHDEIRAGAKRLNMSVAEALGLPPNMTETEALAVRDLEVAAARTVQDYAARVRMSRSAEDMLAFRRSITVYRALGAQVRAQGKFAGRLLNSRKIMAKGSKQQLEAIEQVIQTEGTEDIMNLANMIEVLDDPEKVAKFIKDLDKATAGDVLHEMFINNILSSSLTFAANMIGNSTTLAMSLAHTANGALVSKLFGDGSEVHFREVQESMYGMMRAMSEAWVLAKDAFRDDFLGAGKYEESASRVKQRRSIVSSTFGVDENTYLGQAIDAIGAAWRTPTRGLRATDKFYNTIASRMELHRLAYRDAVDAFTKSGKAMTQDEVGLHMAKFLADPPLDALKKAQQFAKKNTFVDEFEGQFARNISRLSGVKVARNFFPFMHTPMKIFQYSLENTPFAPASREFRRKLTSSDPNEAAIARGQYGLAVAAFLAIGDMYDRKMVVGSYDTSNPGAAQSQRRTGYQPCSIIIGDKSVQVSRVEPFGSSLCMMIDVWSAMDKMDMADTGQLAAGALLHLMDSWQDKAFLRTYSDMMKGMNDGRADIVEGILGNLVTGHVVPMSGLVGQVERVTAPSDKDVAVSPQDPGLAWINRILNETTSHIPFMSDRLPDKVNLWGETQTRLNGLDDRWFNRAYAGLSPINIGKSESPDLAKYDAILQATGEYPLMPERKIGDYDMTGQQYREYVVRAGTLARNYLNRVWPSVSKLGSMEDQADIIRKVIQNSRDQAKAEFASKLPITDRVRALKKDTSKGVEERRVWGMTLEQVKALEVPSGTTPVPSR